jgi:probable rRNA maturation factor
MFTFHYFKIPKNLSHSYCEKVAKALEKVVKIPQNGRVNLIVISAQDMASMNQQYRGKEGPTDILTFSYYTPDSKKDDVVGEIYLCLEKIKIYAKERGITYQEQLEHIIIHGLVHLIGYDHETEKQSKEMENIELSLKKNLV